VPAEEMKRPVGDAGESGEDVRDKQDREGTTGVSCFLAGAQYWCSPKSEPAAVES